MAVASKPQGKIMHRIARLNILFLCICIGYLSADSIKMPSEHIEKNAHILLSQGLTTAGLALIMFSSFQREIIHYAGVFIQKIGIIQPRLLLRPLKRQKKKYAQADISSIEDLHFFDQVLIQHTILIPAMNQSIKT